ncbi:MAG TPA: tRNA uridine-5-carboxymethylaminomethyl(34) synthesis enzyme MnmG [Bacillota bacterium]|nr:tRNA uridine-5-carboxymethylaminomethyl(34) synthesis enzyme MnmG [Bacillota bacterium]HOL10261.1 tRNA uridine-5-carboxymethylaminomethyl(34) synthesis enzyme MnmG [Bacillota bacterium]
MEYQADVIVVGAGHAGCEAAHAAAKMGCKTILFTLNFNNIAFMPCNPSIGGPAKGHLVREIDALGGLMGKIIDQTYIQMRILNTQKGPAVWALRAQADKSIYQRTMQNELEKIANLIIKQAEIVELLFNEQGAITGVKTRTGINYNAKAVVLATGTFLRGRIFIGPLNYASGPMGQLPADYLSDSLINSRIKLERFKTGTPARVRKRSIDFSKTIIQPGGYQEHGFSFWQKWQVRKDFPCWLTYTNPQTHQIIREHLHEAALYTGAITGTGPRYCPSIEGKLIQFPDKERHQVFIEPEGIDTDEMYLAGISTSLPEYVQEKFIRTIPGLENVEIVRPGYAIEYDYIPGNQLKPSLELKNIPGLFSAGQLNGSSGYEEAAAQGLIAGINAVLYTRNQEPLVIKRSEGYIGVLLDDLVTKENTEPYRLLTSRAEFRLTLRTDNADERLTPYGIKLGLINNDQAEQFYRKYEKIKELQNKLNETFLTPDSSIRELFNKLNLIVPKNRFNVADVFRRPETTPENIIAIVPELNAEYQILKEVGIRLKYEGYLKKEHEQVTKMLSLENKKIPDDIDYQLVPNLAREGREKLEKYRPITIGQAYRISGINPADITALLFYIENRKRLKNNE